MTATVDRAGRVVIPKALRERAGLVPGTQVEFGLHDGHVVITAVESTGPLTTIHGVSFPQPPAHAHDLTVTQIREVIEDSRQERIDRQAGAVG